MASSQQVRVLNVTHVQPDRTSIPEAAEADHTVKLSFLDSFHVATGAIQRLFFYEGPDLPPFPSLVRSLQSSLAATIAVFLPLAGKLTFRPSTGDVVVDCSPAAVSSGVKFVVAEYSGGADGMRCLASDDEHDIGAFTQLVPDLDASELPAPVLAVQITRPAAGNDVVAVGVSIHHAVADGQSVWQFMKWWSAASREGSVGAALGLVPPTFDRTAIRHPKARELADNFLRLLAPELPLLKPPSSTSAQQRRRTFLLRADQVQSLKRRLSGGGTPLSKPASTYVAVSSLAWMCIVRAKPELDPADDVYLMVNADCRRRLRLVPLGEGFIGNCVKPCYARAKVGDMRGGEEGRGFARAAAAIQAAIREYVEEPEEPFGDIEALVELHLALPPGRWSAVGSFTGSWRTRPTSGGARRGASSWSPCSGTGRWCCCSGRAAARCRSRCRSIGRTWTPSTTTFFRLLNKMQMLFQFRLPDQPGYFGLVSCRCVQSHRAGTGRSPILNFESLLYSVYFNTFFI